jgi:hypothetical protein
LCRHLEKALSIQNEKKNLKKKVEAVSAILQSAKHSDVSSTDSDDKESELPIKRKAVYRTRRPHALVQARR